MFPKFLAFTLTEICLAATIAIPAWHPKIDGLLSARTKAPSNHPLVNSQLKTVSNNFKGETGHPNCDTLIQNGRSLPGGHPKLDPYMSYATFVYNPPRATIPWWHPGIDSSWTAQTVAPSNHPLVNSYFTNDMPLSHPSIDLIIKNPSAYTMPSYHPQIDPFLSYLAKPNVYPVLNISWWHPSIDALAKAGTSAPSGHPIVNNYFTGINGYPSEHPNIDSIIANPNAYSFPSGHPNIDEWVKFGVAPLTTVSSVYENLHPSIDTSMAAGAQIPDHHPLVSNYFSSLLPPDHPNIDTILNNVAAHPYPSWHPKVDKFVNFFPKPTPFVAVNLTPGHPLIQASYSKGIATPSGHPKVNSYFKAVMPTDHPDVDVLLSNPSDKIIPSWHPAISDYVGYDGDTESSAITSYPYWHPNIMDQYRLGVATPNGHRLYQKYFQSVLPDDHPDIDMLMADPKTVMPEFHPDVDSYILRRGLLRPGHLIAIYALSILLITVAIKWGYKSQKIYFARLQGNYGKVDDQKFKLTEKEQAIIAGVIVPTKIGSTENASLPKLLKDKIINPSAPISNDEIIKSGPRPSFMKPALPPKPLNLIGGKVIQKPLVPANPVTINQHRKPTLESGKGPTSEIKPTRPPPPPPARNLQLKKSIDFHNLHKAADLYEYNITLPDAPPTLPPKLFSDQLEEKQVSRLHSMFAVVTNYRIPGTDWTVGNVFILFAYFLLNAFALFVPFGANELKLGLGSLAAANTMILVIPATRNSILTWLLRLPFDHVVLYHRWLGRGTITLALAHFIFYFPEFIQHYSEQVFWTGLLAFICGCVIFATSLDWVRRNKFNVFFWVHYVFVGFYLFSYFHVQEARPFLLIGMGFYGVDLILRSVWTFIPRRCIQFGVKGKSICQVRFPKNPITEALGQHKVGQYFFVNFPELSLTEWHPFSVSSGPRENSVELHIRALGDHTKVIVNHANECVKIGKKPWIRFDGPYGVHDFNYRRYSVLMLAGGGIGITPVMGMIKDIYHVGKFSPALKAVTPHIMEAVYVAWVMPNTDDAVSFMDDLKKCMEISALPQFPPLVVWVYITKAKPEELSDPMIAGRPDFQSMFDGLAKNHPEKATLTFACGPDRMVAELWDLSMSRTAKGARVDFHHETFNF